MISSPQSGALPHEFPLGRSKQKHKKSHHTLMTHLSKKKNAFGPVLYNSGLRDKGAVFGSPAARAGNQSITQGYAHHETVMRRQEDVGVQGMRASKFSLCALWDVGFGNCGRQNAKRLNTP